MVEDGSGRPAGFVVAALDTLRFEQRCEHEWWPPLRERYRNPLTTSQPWSLDQQAMAAIHRPERTEVLLARDYPSHLHVALLPEVQGHGWGRMLDRVGLSMSSTGGAHPACISASTTPTGGRSVSTAISASPRSTATRAASSSVDGSEQAVQSCRPDEPVFRAGRDSRRRPGTAERGRTGCSAGWCGRDRRHGSDR